MAVPSSIWLLLNARRSWSVATGAWVLWNAAWWWASHRLGAVQVQGLCLQLPWTLTIGLRSTALLGTAGPPRGEQGSRSCLRWNWRRTLHGSNTAWVKHCMGQTLHGSAWICMKPSSACSVPATPPMHGLMAVIDKPSRNPAWVRPRANETAILSRHAQGNALQHEAPKFLATWGTQHAHEHCACQSKWSLIVGSPQQHPMSVALWTRAAGLRGAGICVRAPGSPSRLPPRHRQGAPGWIWSLH